MLVMVVEEELVVVMRILGDQGMPGQKLGKMIWIEDSWRYCF